MLRTSLPCRVPPGTGQEIRSAKMGRPRKRASRDLSGGCRGHVAGSRLAELGGNRFGTLGPLLHLDALGAIELRLTESLNQRSSRVSEQESDPPLPVSLGETARVDLKRRCGPAQIFTKVVFLGNPDHTADRIGSQRADAEVVSVRRCLGPVGPLVVLGLRKRRRAVGQFGGHLVAFLKPLTSASIFAASILPSLALCGPWHQIAPRMA